MHFSLMEIMAYQHVLLLFVLMRKKFLMADMLTRHQFFLGEIHYF